MNTSISLNLERIPKELSLILEIINLENLEKKSIKSLKHILDIDWNLFNELAIHHRIYPILYSKLIMIEENWVPKFVVEKIYDEYKKNTFQMLHLSAVMGEISREFEVNDIRNLYLKGPVLAEELYGDLSLRTCRDLDILIQIDDLEKADKLFLKLGYEKDNVLQLEPVLNDWKWRHHHISYFQPSTRVKVEIHWRLNPGPGKEPGFDELWARRRKSSNTNHPINYLGREDLYFFLVTHGARHGWSRLRWLVDIHQIIGQGIDWEKAEKLLWNYQYQHLSGQALILSSRLLLTQIPNEISTNLNTKLPAKLAQKTIFYFENMVNLHREPLPEYVSKYHDRYLLSLKTYPQRLIFYISALYPSITDINTLKLPRNLYFLYFLLRPIFWALRIKKKQSLS